MIFFKRIFFLPLFSVVVLAAAVFRLQGLSHRPMHTDEAVHAFQFGTLLEKGIFHYDPAEYHGPTLIYFTMIPAWLRGEKTLSDVDDKTLRLVPVFFGVGLILLLLLLVQGLGKRVVLAAAFWTAISAPMVFYSRYYIHEMLFVFFSFLMMVCAYRFFQNGKMHWIALLGVSAGLMHATKESCVLSWGAMAAAFLLLAIEHRFRQNRRLDGGKAVRLRHIVVCIAGAAAVSALLYSSFFSHPAGIEDSIRAFAIYLRRSSTPSAHDHSWTYYIRLLLFWHVPGKPVWTEIPTVVLACVGVFAAFEKFKIEGMDARLIRFFVYYTAILAAVYTAIPYKTPWNALGFYHGMVLLAGAGTVVLLRDWKRKIGKWISASLLILLVSSSIRQSAALNGQYDSDPGNPWMYAQAGASLFQITKAVDDVAKIYPEKLNMPIQVIAQGHEYWPLPWYFRKFTRVGWYARADSLHLPAPVILVTPQEEPPLVRKLYEQAPPGSLHLYVPLWNAFTELRPGVEIRGYIRKDVWDMVQSGNTARTDFSNPQQ